MPKPIPEAAETRHPKKVAFLAAYAQTGIISAAAKAADVERHTPREWVKNDPEFKRAFKNARNQAADMLEAEALRRATRGVERGVWHAGREVGKEREYSDTLLIFLLKGSRPKKFRDNHRFEHSGPKGKPIEVENRTSAQKFLTNPAALKLALEADRLTREAARLEGGGDAPPTA